MSFLKNHWAILLLALTLALIIKAPIIAFPHVAGDSYRGINIYHFANLSVDEDFYMSRGREVLEGNKLGNPLLREGKNLKPDYYFTINEYVLVGPLRLLGLADKINIVTLYNIYNFVGVFVLILFIYFFALQLKADKLFAAATAISIVGGYTLIFYRTFFEPLFNMYGRSLYPYLSSLAFFAYLILCARALKAPSLGKSLFAGVALGVLFYVYSYAATFALIFNAFLFLIFAFKKDWRLVKRIFLISGLGILIGAYNILRFMTFMNSPAGQQFSYFYRAVYENRFAYSKLGPLILVLFGIFAYKKRGDKNWPILYALLLAGWFSINQQVITGLSIRAEHYLWYYTVPALIIASSYVLWSFITTKRVRLIIFCLAITTFFLNTTGEQYGAFFKTLEVRLYEQNYKTALDILNRDLQPGVVLAADDDHQLLITSYTPHDLFWQRLHAQFNDNPLERQEDALALYVYLNKEARQQPGDYFNKILKDKNEEIFYKALYQDIEGYYSGLSFGEYDSRAFNNDEALLLYRQNFIKSFVRDYDALVGDPDGFEKILTKYGVNWVLWDKNQHPEWDLSVLRGLKEVSSYNDIFLFERSK